MKEQQLKFNFIHQIQVKNVTHFPTVIDDTDNEIRNPLPQSIDRNQRAMSAPAWLKSSDLD